MNKNQEYPIYLFHKGENYESYKLMCPRHLKDGKKDGYIFRVWAPNALSVSVVGDFNNWDNELNPMEKISVGIWETFIDGAKQFDNYKYCVEQSTGKKVLKSDPFATHTETSPGTASKLYDLDNFKWTDDKWLNNRDKVDPYTSPMNIYELHIGSWKKYDDGNFYDYEKLADELIPYVKKMNYTHIELMPVTEYPFNGSWGYQITGMFAPSSRYGTPKAFMKFIDKCHKAGLYVIIDWVSAHFPKDDHGLYMFDGGPLFEYSDKQKREHIHWGTVIFDYGRNEVLSFLISSAMFWCDYYHIDGIRMDAVASMIYLDYGRDDDNWTKNIEGGNHNLEALKFIKTLNNTVLTNHKGVVMIAEESTAFPMITMPVDVGGLGFNFKWNMGWMNDTLKYIKSDPFFRKDMHNNLTFSFHYAYNENYILPLSHDEVVHGKGSLVNKMPGYYADKFKGLMTYLGYMMAHPGKKLMFMGGEFGQFIEWDYAKQLDWFLLKYEAHERIQKFNSDLNKYYIDNKPFYELDNDPAGFDWICGDDNKNNILSFSRLDKNGEFIIAVMNFSPCKLDKYKIGVPVKGKYFVDFSSDDYYHSNKKLEYKSFKEHNHNKNYTIEIYVPENSVQYIKLKK